VSENTTELRVDGQRFENCCDVDVWPALTLTNSLVDGECRARDITSLGHNIESPGNTCGFGVSVPNLKLGPLQNNGGPTETHALEEGSPAIDQIPEVDCIDAEGAPLMTDQRGQPRPETGGTMCDVGAFERQVPCDGPEDCDDKNECTEDTCDPTDGCVFTAVEDCCDGPEDCDDRNECTEDTCDPTDGCIFTAVEDWTECGSQGWVCIAGECVSSPA
jgi:hypothetical protein